MSRNDEMEQIIQAAELEADGKDMWGRLGVYNKYKYYVYELFALGEAKPYIERLLDALKL